MTLKTKLDEITMGKKVRLIEVLDKDLSAVTSKEILIALSYEISDLSERLITLEERRVQINESNIKDLTNRVAELESNRKINNQLISTSWKIIIGISVLTSIVSSLVAAWAVLFS